jgi:acyl carrier protein
MPENVAEQSPARSARTVADVQNWLVDKVASRLGVAPAEVAVDKYFDEFDLDSTEALVLSGELENWLGFELETTALWYHPTIADLAKYIVEERARDGAAG